MLMMEGALRFRVSDRRSEMLMMEGALTTLSYHRPSCVFRLIEQLVYDEGENEDDVCSVMKINGDVNRSSLSDYRLEVVNMTLALQ